MNDSTSIDPLEPYDPEDSFAPPAQLSPYRNRTQDTTADLRESAASGSNGGEPNSRTDVARGARPPRARRENSLSVLAGLAAGGILFVSGFVVGRMLDSGTKPDTGRNIDADSIARLTTRLDEMSTEIRRTEAGLAKSLERIEPMRDPATGPALDAMKSNLERLAASLKGLQPPDLKPLEAGQARLATGQSENVVKVESLSQQVAGLEKAISEQKEVLAVNLDRLHAAIETKPRPAQAETLEADLASAAAMLANNQVVPALDAFAKLRETYPLDARLWYCSGIANGIRTNTWVGKTENLMNVGVGLEMVRRPEAKKIDDAFSEKGVVKLPSQQVKNWFAAYRARANVR